MSTATHEIAPEGDIILVVENPNAPFAPCPPPASTQLSATTESANALDDAGPSPKVRIRVSSAHLKLTSPFFQRALSGNWKEARTLRESGSVEIETSDWDVEALLLLMRILHCKLSELPKGIDIERLAKLLVLVDYYECQSLLGFIGERWPSQQFSFEDIRVSMIRLWVAWALNNAAAFHHYSVILIRHAHGPITSLGLPIPGQVIGME
jgi:hypothetical protein